jgi:hypothetical protein
VHDKIVPLVRASLVACHMHRDSDVATLQHVSQDCKPKLRASCAFLHEAIAQAACMLAKTIARLYLLVKTDALPDTVKHMMDDRDGKLSRALLQLHGCRQCTVLQ